MPFHVQLLKKNQKKNPEACIIHKVMRTFEVTVINWNEPGCKSESANFKVYT